jgi:Mn-dependent DtxR family transcriptional regulator
MDDGPIIDVLGRKGPLKPGSIASELGDNVEVGAVEDALQDMAERDLVEPSAAIPGALQLTERGLQSFHP